MGIINRIRAWRRRRAKCRLCSVYGKVIRNYYDTDSKVIRYLISARDSVKLK